YPFPSFLPSFTYMLFLFHCHLDLLDLPSFPTRRSSDLLLLSSAPRFAVDTFLFTLCPSVSVFNVDASLFTLLSWAPRFAVDTFLDRKSTRLNSSHVSISYAVFCLKKKTINIIYSHSIIF